MPERILHQNTVLRVPADGQVRALSPPAQTGLAKLESAKTPIRAPIALACGDFGEGREEILIVGRQTLAIGALKNGKFESRVSRPYADLSPVAGAPLRLPLGAAVSTHEGTFVGVSDREEFLLLDHHLRVIGRSKRTYPLGEGLCAPFTETGISSSSEPCPSMKSNTPPGVSNLLEGPGLDAFAVGQMTQAAGTTTDYLATLATGKSELSLSISSAAVGRKSQKLQELGSAIALGDIDGDGTMDLVTSNASAPSEEDLLLVISHLEDTPQPVARRAMKSISALALCPFSGTNPLTIVVASGDQLLLLH
jgi:hypothetical protein